MRYSLLVVCTLFISFGTIAQVFNYEVGDEVRNHIIIDTQGVEYELHDITASGQYIYMDFFFVDCFPCRETTPIFNEFYDKYGCNSGSLFMLSMNAGIDDDAAVIDFENEFGGEFNHAPSISLDGGAELVREDFGVNAYPTFILIGPDNVLLVNGISPIEDVASFEITIPADANAVVLECSLGLNDIETFDFSMYPNPTSGNDINIFLGSNLSQATVTIYNILGTVISSQEYTSNQINISAEMASGTYIVSVETVQGTLNKSLVVK